MDERLRELERRFRTSGLDDDRYALLEARTRAGVTLWDLPTADAVWLINARIERGEFDEARLVLAALAGDELARSALEALHHEPLDHALTFNREGRAWAKRVQALGSIPMLAAATGLAKALAAVTGSSDLADWLEMLLRQGGRPVSGADTATSFPRGGGGERHQESIAHLRRVLYCFQDGGSPVEDRVHESFEAMVGFNLTKAYGSYPLVDHPEVQSAFEWCARWAWANEPVLDPAAASEPIPYTPRSSFEEGQTILHPSFGPGNVVAVQGKTIRVEFADGERRLAHRLNWIRPS